MIGSGSGMIYRAPHFGKISMRSIREYASRCIGTPQKSSFVGKAGRWGMPERREYRITITRLDGDLAVGNVTMQDQDQERRPASSAPPPSREFRFPLSKAQTPSNLMEEIARAVDPEYFRGSPRQSQVTKSAPWEAIQQRIASLAVTANRNQGEAAPDPKSIERYDAFVRAVPLLFPPDIFSSSDGTLRARWQDGAQRSFWLAFPENGPLPWTCTMPREGANGMLKIYARCIEDLDVLQVARQLGVPISR